jgi:hypothetical protein
MGFAPLSRFSNSQIQITLFLHSSQTKTAGRRFLFIAYFFIFGSFGKF